MEEDHFTAIPTETAPYVDIMLFSRLKGCSSLLGRPSCISVAFVCHSNLNRSMEAHHVCRLADPFGNQGATLFSFGAVRCTPINLESFH